MSCLDVKLELISTPIDMVTSLRSPMLEVSCSLVCGIALGWESFFVTDGFFRLRDGEYYMVKKKTT